jgi:hypothetical protein
MDPISKEFKSFHNFHEIKSLISIRELLESLEPIVEYWDAHGCTDANMGADLNDIRAEISAAYVALLETEKKIDSYIKEHKDV